MGNGEIEKKEKWWVRKEIERAGNGGKEKNEKWWVRKEIERAGNGGKEKERKMESKERDLKGEEMEK